LIGGEQAAILHDMSPTAPSYLAGRLLVAMPGIEDGRFQRTVVLLCAHDASHAMGLAINRPVDGLTVPKLLEQLKVDPGCADGAVMLGGPVEPERGFVLHSDDEGLSDCSIVVPGGFALTASRDILESLAGRKPHPRRALMAIGYAGWDGGQLEREIRNNVWLICDSDDELVFGADHDAKWSRSLAKIGVSADRLSGLPGRA
jgi:putative transcriptional regulator